MMMATTSSSANNNNGPVNDDFHKLLLVVKELSQQLDENRQATTKLKLHADLLKVRKTYQLELFFDWKEQLQLYRLGDTSSRGSHPSSPSTRPCWEVVD
jgi:hypothetical protein